MAALAYCSDADVTNRLSDSLADSPIDTAAKRAVELLGPARDWIDSIYAGIAPFPAYTAAAEEWAVNQSDHAAGDTTVVIDGGSNAPSVGDHFRVENQNTFRAEEFSRNWFGKRLGVKIPSHLAKELMHQRDFS